MKIYDLLDHEDRPSAFEVSNFSLGRRGVLRIVRTIPGISVIRSPRRWAISAEPDEFCEFEVGGVRFLVWEPSGDNDRYWIGPQPLRWVSEIEEVREAFAQARRLFDPPLAGPEEFQLLPISNRSLIILGLVGYITFSWITPVAGPALVSFILLLFGAACHALTLLFRHLSRPTDPK